MMRIRLRFKIPLLLLALFFMAKPQQAEAQNSCRSLFRPTLVGYWTAPEEQTLRFVNTDPKSQPELQKEVGRIDFDFMDSTNTLFIEWVSVEPHFQKKGLATQLMREVLQSFPETERVMGYLTDTNKKLYDEKLKATGSAEEALKNTPYYRSLKGLGFTEIVTNTAYDGKVVVVLQKKNQ